jgi:hypothetical protein
MKIGHIRARWKVLSGKIVLSLRSSASVAYSLIRSKSQNSNIRHDDIISIKNVMLMLKKHMHGPQF